jgi:hypothetical protein
MKTRYSECQFDYNELEWAAIADALGRIPTNLERAALKRAAFEYRSSMLDLERGHYWSRRRRATEWKKIAQMARQLSAQICKAESACCNDDPPDPFFTCGFFELHDCFVHGSLGKENSFIGLLAECERRATEKSDEAERHYRRAHSARDIRFTGRESEWPRLRFYRDVLCLWTDAGRNLRVSRTSAGDRSGPAVRYLQAVTGPLMGDEAPTLEGIRDIIKREKIIREKREKIVRERVIDASAWEHRDEVGALYDTLMSIGEWPPTADDTKVRNP